jgi:hypothetical protein
MYNPCNNVYIESSNKIDQPAHKALEVTILTQIWYICNRIQTDLFNYAANFSVYFFKTFSVQLNHDDTGEQSIQLIMHKPF